MWKKVFLISLFTIFNENFEISALNLNSCGRPKVGIGNIYGGERVTIRGAYPWVVTLIKHNGDLLCSGTLVSKRKIVIPAHCIQDKGEYKPRSSNDFKVLVGVYDLDNKFENGRVTTAVQSIYIHPDWNPHSENYDADIAVLILAEDVQYSTYIQPICLMDSNSPAASIKEGIVVGYGKSEDTPNGHEKTPKMIKTPIHDNKSCFKVSYVFPKISSHRTFCGGSANGQGICRGDGGSGLFVKNNGIHYLRGMVSTILGDPSKIISCNVYTYAVYTDILQFENWIHSIEKSLDAEDSIEKPIESISLFQETDNIGTCGNRKIDIRNYNEGERVTTQGAFPWVVTLVELYGIPFCIGTLISRKMVLTSAQCVNPKFKNTSRAPYDFIIHLGAFDLTKRFERGRDRADVQSIHIHPNWDTKYYDYSGDIAALVLTENIKKSPYVQPICLMDENSPASTVKEGIVVGYAFFSIDNKSVRTQKLTEMSVITATRCSSTNPILDKISGWDTFCAANKNKSEVCGRDNGGGFVVLYKGLYYLRGIVSGSIPEFNSKCVANANSIYIKVFKYNNWIRSIEESIDKESKTSSAPVPQQLALISTEKPAPIQTVTQMPSTYAFKTTTTQTVTEKPSTQQATTQSTTSPYPSVSQHGFSDRFCGRPQVPQGNIIGGAPFKAHSFPWIAALMKKRKTFICGGVLVSDRKVVTAAHCIQEKKSDDELNPGDLSIMLGMHDLNDSHEIGRSHLSVWRIYIHKHWNINIPPYDSDIAVVVLYERVVFNNYIQPICLIDPRSTLASEKQGFVVGYGKSENSGVLNEVTPRMVYTPIHTNDECHHSFKELVELTSSTTFCAGTAKGAGVCSGDSGGGLYVRDNTSYYLRGIVSSSLMNIQKYGCDVDSYSVFTDVLKFNDWINSVKLHKSLD